MEGSEKFLRLKETSERSVGQNLVRAVGQTAVRIREQGTVLVREQESRSDGVDPEALAELYRKLAGQILGPVGHSGLGHTITGHTGKRPERSLAAEVDDRTFLLSYHRLGEHHSRKDSAEQVEIHHLAHSLNIQVEDCLLRRNRRGGHVASGGVKQDIDPAKLRHDLLAVCLKCILVKHICSEEASLTTLCLDLGHNGLTLLGGTVKIQKSDLRALRGEIFHNCGSENPAGPRHHHHFTFDVKKIIHDCCYLLII